MRVTDKLIFDNAIRDNARSLEQAQSAQQAVSSGARVTHPSDDPAAAGLMQTIDIQAAQYDVIGRTAALAQNELNAADNALQGIGNALARAQQLAVQLSNGSYDANSRASGAVEVQQLVSQVVALANTQFGNRYIFGGNEDGAPPFDASGNYSGDSAVRQVEIAPGVLQDASVRADLALKGGASGTDLFATLQSLQAALSANDPAAVQSTLTGISASIQQVATARAQVGVSLDTFVAAQSAAKTAATDQRAQASTLGDVDLATAASQLALAQTALQASYAASAQSFRLSLLNYLG